MTASLPPEVTRQQHLPPETGFLPSIYDERSEGDCTLSPPSDNSNSDVTSTRTATTRFPPLGTKRSNSLFNIRANTRRDTIFQNVSFRRNRSQSLTSSNTPALRKRTRRPCSIHRENMKLLKHKYPELAFDYASQKNSLQSYDELMEGADSSIRLEEHIKLRHLQKLLQIFKSHQPSEDQKENKSEKNEDSTQVKQGPGMMNMQEFTTIISDMLGTTRWNDQMEKLFHKVDTACDNYVDWNEFCTYMLLQMREIEHKQSLKSIPFSTSVVVKQIFQNKQETTTKSVIVENPSRIVTVSKVGAICVWDLELRLLKSYNLSADVAESQRQTTRRRFHTWVTDMVYMRNTQNLALATSNREIYFYDISTPTYSIEYCLYALPNVPVCAHYWYKKSSRNSHSMLYFGDDSGEVHVLHFHAPQSRLFQKPFAPKQGVQRVYFNELKDHRQYVTYECLGRVHNEVVRRVMYVPGSNVVISSSMSSLTSVVLNDCEQKKDSYIFRVNKGVECFDFSKSLNILVTGSLDHLVRVWNPYVVAKPITILRGHNTGICDVTINEAYAQIITYSKDAMIKVWDIKEHSCLQTISPKFPSLQPGRIPEHGEFPLSLYGSPHDVMLASCNDSIAMLKMGKIAPKEVLPTTHNAPLCGALYNQLFHQVVTASDDSTVSVWDVETGSRSLTFSNAHAQEEITCLSFDLTNRRLFTGARDGSIKIWNFQNGNCLHELEAVAEAEVTAVIAYQERTILAVGWSRLISLYDDSDPDIVNVSVKTNWKGGQLHKDDILTAAHGHPHLLATGSYDGTIIVWNEETQQVFMKLKVGKPGKNSDAKRPIDLLVFLHGRSHHSKRNRASLISSEEGTLYWWCLFGRRTLLGYFHAASTKDGSVLAITSSPDDVYLVTGDTSGYVTVWNIEEYCVTDQGETVDTEKPPAAYHWRAHDRAVVSVNYVQHQLQAMIVTASTDKTSRLWTLEGRLIGTFGQRKQWNLKNLKSYQYPKDPWGVFVSAPEPGHAFLKYHSLSAERQSGENIEADLPGVEPSAIDEQVKQSDLTASEPPLAEDDGSDKKDEEDEIVTEDFEKESKLIDHELAGLNPQHDEIENEDVKSTIATDDVPVQENGIIEKDDDHGLKSVRFKSVLGEQAEGVFAKRAATRQDRRNRVGLIDEKCTTRFGNLCSPFQALSIRNTDSVVFEPTMPMTKRMRNKGMQCSNEAELSKMPLHHLLDFNETEPTKQSKKRSNHQATPRRATMAPSAGTPTPSVSSTQTSKSTK